MGNLTEAINWEAGIYQLEQTDLVLAGAGGIANQQAQQLANRTAFLYDLAKGFEGITAVSASATLTLAQVKRKLVLVNADNATLAFNLPTLGSGDANLRVCAKAVNVNKSQVTINTGSTVVGVGASVLYLGEGDSFELIWTGTAWYLLSFNGNINEVGVPTFAYKQLINSVIASGQLLNRADYPRLWAYVQTLGGSLVSDATWFSGITYSGFFSAGNGSSTFRVPDLRSQFLRGLDLGRGLDYGRTGSNAGAYEADELKDHDHFISSNTTTENPIPVSSLPYIAGRSVPGNNGDYTLSMVNTIPNKGKTSKTGGAETRAKNIGLIPLILV